MKIIFSKQALASLKKNNSNSEEIKKEIEKEVINRHSANKEKIMLDTYPMNRKFYCLYRLYPDTNTIKIVQIVNLEENKKIITLTDIAVLQKKKERINEKEFEDVLESIATVADKYLSLNQDVESSLDIDYLRLYIRYKITDCKIYITNLKVYKSLFGNDY